MRPGPIPATPRVTCFDCHLNGHSNGTIGNVHTVIAHLYKAPKRYTGLSEEPIPTGLDWNLWTGPTAMHPYNRLLQERMEGYQGWAQWWDYSGGDVTLHGAHAADQIQFTLGKDDTGPVEVWPTSEGYAGRVEPSGDQAAIDS